MSRGLSSGAHSVHELHYHFVCVTKYRRKVLSLRAQELLRSRLLSYLAEKEITVEEFGAEPDHLHLLVRVPPRVSPSELAQFVKGGSSRYLRQLNLPEIRNERRLETLCSHMRTLDCEVDEVREAIIKNGTETRTIWEGTEVRRYDENHRLTEISRNGASYLK